MFENKAGKRKNDDQGDLDPANNPDLIPLDTNQDGKVDAYLSRADGEVYDGQPPEVEQKSEVAQVEGLQQSIDLLAGPVLNNVPVTSLSLENLPEILEEVEDALSTLEVASEHAQQVKVSRLDRLFRRTPENVFAMTKVYPYEVIICKVGADDFWTMFTGDLSVEKKQQRIAEMRKRFVDYVTASLRDNKRRTVAHFQTAMPYETAYANLFTGQVSLIKKDFDAGLFAYVILHAQQMQLLAAELAHAANRNAGDEVAIVLSKLKSYKQKLEDDIRQIKAEKAVTVTVNMQVLPKLDQETTAEGRLSVLNLIRSQVAIEKRPTQPVSPRYFGAEQWQVIADRMNIDAAELASLLAIGQISGKASNGDKAYDLESVLSSIVIACNNQDYAKYAQLLNQIGLAIHATQEGVLDQLISLYDEVAYAWLEEMSAAKKRFTDPEFSSWLKATRMLSDRKLSHGQKSKNEQDE